MEISGASTFNTFCALFCCLLEDGCRQSLYTFAQNQNDVGIVKWNYVTLSHCTNILYSLENTSQRQVQENGRQCWLCPRPQTSTSNWIMRRIFAIFSILQSSTHRHRQIVGENEQQMDHVNHHGNVVHTECSCDHGHSDKMLNYMLIYRAQLFSYFF